MTKSGHDCEQYQEPLDLAGCRTGLYFHLITSALYAGNTEYPAYTDVQVIDTSSSSKQLFLEN